MSDEFKRIHKLAKKFNITYDKKLPEWILEKYRDETLTNDEYEVMLDHAEYLIDMGEFADISLLTDEERDLWHCLEDIAYEGYPG